VITKRHVKTFFDLFEPERRAINQLLDVLRIDVMKKDVSVSGFNIGMNNGDTAGQTIGHAHLQRGAGSVDGTTMGTSSVRARLAD
jgi:diadenosine tetraphosphate (Ap4A) HIT family hydrolase